MHSQVLNVLLSLLLSSNHLLALYLFEACLSLRLFREMSNSLSPTERKALDMTRITHQDWFVPVLRSWMGVVAKKVRTSIKSFQGHCIAKERHSGPQLPVRVERSFNCEMISAPPADLRNQEDEETSSFPAMIHSSASDDFVSAVQLIKDFWKQLDWADATNSKVLLAVLVEVGNACASKLLL